MSTSQSRECYWVSSSIGTFGVDVVNGVVVEAAPIARWAVGKKLWVLLAWLEKKSRLEVLLHRYDDE